MFGDLERGAFFWLVFLVGIPVGVLLCQATRSFLYLVFAGLILSIVFTIDIHFMSREQYRAVSRGFQLSMTDMLAVVLFVSMMLRPSQYRLKIFPPMMMLFWLYFICGVISWALIPEYPFLPSPKGIMLKAHSEINYFEPWLYPLFELWNTLRGMFIFWVVANFTANDENAVPVAATCLTILAFNLSLHPLLGRYLYGLTRGTSGGYNELAAIVGYLSVFLIPFMLSTKRYVIFVLLFVLQLCALVALVLTLSRAGMVGYLLGGSFAIVWGLWRYPSMRNGASVLVALVCFSLLLAKGWNSLMDRFVYSIADMPFRDDLNTIALFMVADHPFGVGLGNYAALDWFKYGKMIPSITLEARYIVAHNIWYLTLAEVGYPGFIAFLMLWIRYYILLIQGLWGKLSHIAVPYVGPTMLGSLSSSFVLLVQNNYHFSFRESELYFLFCVISALTVGVYNQIKFKNLPRALQSA